MTPINVVVVQKGQWKLYRGGCGAVLDEVLFWGPEYALDFAIAGSEEESKSTGWHSEVEVDGAYLLDLDRNALLWSGGEETLHHVPYRRSHLALMGGTEQWSGWAVRWATLEEIGAYVGVPAKTFMVEESPKTIEPVMVTGDPRYDRILLSVEQDGRVFLGQVRGTPSSLLRGEQDFSRLVALAEQEILQWDDWEIGKAPGFPVGGLALECSSRTLSFWFSDPLAGMEERVRDAWPTWKTRWLGDRFEEQFGQILPESLQLPPHDALTMREAVWVRLLLKAGWEPEKFEQLKRLCIHDVVLPPAG